MFLLFYEELFLSSLLPYAGCREKERRNFVVCNPKHKPCRAFGVPSLYFENINFVYEDIPSPVFLASFFCQI